MRNVMLLAAAALIAGCSNTTETGYSPRKLGDSMTVQRGYYATPFSPEQRAAQQELQQGSDLHRPDVFRGY